MAYGSIISSIDAAEMTWRFWEGITTLSMWGMTAWGGKASRDPWLESVYLIHFGASLFWHLTRHRAWLCTDVMLIRVLILARLFRIDRVFFYSIGLLTFVLSLKNGISKSDNVVLAGISHGLVHLNDRGVYVSPTVHVVYIGVFTGAAFAYSKTLVGCRSSRHTSFWVGIFHLLLGVHAMIEEDFYSFV